MELRALGGAVAIREGDAPDVVIATPRIHMHALIASIKADGPR